jgi:predicted transcriptional regulator
MKTRSIEVDDDTATVLTQRAAERGVSVPELVAELVTLEAGPVVASAGEIAELDRRWKAFEAQGSVVANDDVVRWLQSWGTPHFASPRRGEAGSHRQMRSG